MSGKTVALTTYLFVFGALMLLLAATVAVHFMNLGSTGTAFGILIAIVKALLVAAFFMHLRWSSRVIWVAAGAGCFWLAIMVSLSMSDYFTRGWMQESGKQQGRPVSTTRYSHPHPRD